MEDRTTGGAGRSNNRLRITWVKSAIGYRESQRLTIKSLGLRKLNQTVEHYDSATIRGMLKKVHHLVRVEELGEVTGPIERGETGTQRFARRMEKKAREREEFLAFVNEQLARAEAEPAPAPRRKRAAAETTDEGEGVTVTVTATAPTLQAAAEELEETAEALQEAAPAPAQRARKPRASADESA